jgi:hypothetical protein
MKIAFDLTKEDLIAFNLHRQQSSSTLRRQRRLVAGIFVVTGLVIAAFLLRHPFPSELSVCWMAVAVFLLTPLFLPGSYRRNTIRLVGRLIDEGRNRSLLGRREITMTPVDLCAASELRSTTVRWKAVERIEEDLQYLYIYVSSLEAIIIPRRAFAGDSDFEAFAAGVRKHWQASELANKA